jgi:hypothetical protein
MTLLKRSLHWTLPTTPKERVVALWAAGYFFMLLAGYYVLRPLRDQMGIAGGVKTLPWMFMATFLTLLVMQPLFGALVKKLPRRWFIAIVYQFFVVNLALFWLLLTWGISPVLVARVFFVWVSVFNLFVVAVFWSLMADLFTSEQGKRLFGFIGAGGTAGTLLGPAIGLIVGPGDETDRFTYWPVRLSRGGEVLAPGDGSDPVQIIDARDLAEWTIRMAEARAVGTYNATGPAHALTMRQMLTGIASAIHANPTIEWVSTDFLKAEKVEAWSDMPTWIPGRGDTAGFGRRSIKKAIANGLTFRPLSQTASDTLAWFKQQPAERQEKLKAGIAPEREKEVLAKWAASGKPKEKSKRV